MNGASDQSATRESATEETNTTGVSRRAAMGALGLAGLGLMSGQVGAQSGSRQPWYSWEGDVDADGNDLTGLGGLELAASETITDFAGANLSVDEGVLNADVPDGAGSMANAVDVDDYGADPTGEEPSDDALEAAIDALSDGDYLLLTNGEYWFDEQHVIYNDYVTVLGTGSEIRASGVEYGSYPFVLAFGTFDAVSDFGGDSVNATDVSEGQQTIDVEDVSPFAAGDHVIVAESKYDNAPRLGWGGAAGRGNCPTNAVIREIDGSTLYLDRGLNYDHDAGNAGVFLIDGVVGGRFVDLHLTDGDGENETEGFLQIAYSRDCQIINCTAEEYVGFAFRDIHSLRTKMIDCEAKNPVLPERASSHWEPFFIAGSTDTTLVRPSADTCRRGIDINAGSKVVRVFDPRIRNAYLHGACFHSNATQPVFGAYEIYGGRIEGAAEILHDKYHFGAGLSMSPNQSHVKAFGTTVVGVPSAVHTPYGTAPNLTLEGCRLETHPLSSGTVINGELENSRLENVEIVGRGGNDSRAVDLGGAENVSLSGQVSGDFQDDVVYVGNAENVSLEVDVLDNTNATASDIVIEDAENVSVSGNLHGSGRSVATSGDVSDVRIVDVDADVETDAPPIGHHGSDGTVSNLWVTGCNTVGGENADVDFSDELSTKIEGLWIQNNVCGAVSFHGSEEDDDTFVRDNLTGQ